MPARIVQLISHDGTLIALHEDGSVSAVEFTKDIFDVRRGRGRMVALVNAPPAPPRPEPAPAPEPGGTP